MLTIFFVIFHFLSSYLPFRFMSFSLLFTSNCFILIQYSHYYFLFHPLLCFILSLFFPPSFSSIIWRFYLVVFNISSWFIWFFGTWDTNISIFPFLNSFVMFVSIEKSLYKLSLLSLYFVLFYALISSMMLLRVLVGLYWEGINLSPSLFMLFDPYFTIVS